MKNLIVTFELWSISDGNYNPFHKGQKVSFALNIERAKIRKSKRKQFYLKQSKFSDYLILGEVICNYTEEKRSHMANDNFIVINTGQYKFFMHKSGDAFPYKVGEFIVGKGQITVDYFIWGEQSYKIENVPDIYNDFIIEKIQFVKIPTTYIVETDDIVISPTYLSSNEFSDIDIVEVEDMADYFTNEEVNEEESEEMNDDIVEQTHCSFTLFELKKVISEFE
jgi:hypothetical protein